MKKRAYLTPEACPELLETTDILTLSEGEDNDMNADFIDLL